jgi:hypothetical protein
MVQNELAFSLNDAQSSTQISQIKAMMQQQKEGKVLEYYKILLESLEDDRRDSAYYKTYMLNCQDYAKSEQILNSNYDFKKMVDLIDTQFGDKLVDPQPDEEQKEILDVMGVNKNFYIQPDLLEICREIDP